VDALEPLRADPARSAVLLDIDGTLAPIVRHADDAHVPEATRGLLIEVAKRYRLVGCISGRRATSARQIVAIGSIAYVGNHGGELLHAGAARPTPLHPEIAAWSERVHAFAARVHTPELQRLRVRSEDKDAIVAFHWRGAPDEAAAAAAVEEIAERAQADGLAVHWGRKVLEVRPPMALDKGLGVSALLCGSLAADGRALVPDGASAVAAPGSAAVDSGSARGPVAADGGPVFQAAMYAGDDTTDLDAFRRLRALVQAGTLGCAVCVAVRSEEAPPELVREADLAIDGPGGVRALLEALL
jgi:trehalose 6-phosphate phosphatase